MAKSLNIYRPNPFTGYIDKLSEKTRPRTELNSNLQGCIFVLMLSFLLGLKYQQLCFKRFIARKTYMRHQNTIICIFLYVIWQN